MRLGAGGAVSVAVAVARAVERALWEALAPALPEAREEAVPRDVAVAVPLGGALLLAVLVWDAMPVGGAVEVAEAMAEAVRVPAGLRVDCALPLEAEVSEGVREAQEVALAVLQKEATADAAEEALAVGVAPALRVETRDEVGGAEKEATLLAPEDWEAVGVDWAEIESCAEGEAVAQAVALDEEDGGGDAEAAAVVDDAGDTEAAGLTLGASLAVALVLSPRDARELTLAVDVGEASTEAETVPVPSRLSEGLRVPRGVGEALLQAVPSAGLPVAAAEDVTVGEPTRDTDTVGVGGRESVLVPLVLGLPLRLGLGACEGETELHCVDVTLPTSVALPPPLRSAGEGVGVADWEGEAVLLGVSALVGLGAPPVKLPVGLPDADAAMDRVGVVPALPVATPEPVA